jgi:periplasmic protein TonB
MINLKYLLSIISFLFFITSSWSQIDTLSRLSFSSTNEKKDSISIFDVPDIIAEFPGGRSELNRYLSDSIHPPERLLKSEIQRKVYVRFFVSKEGSISNVRILKGMPECPECDEEVLRVYKAMPNWKPAKLDGEPIDSYYNSRVLFGTP